jgi:CRISPR/Cas system-associated exonuclease Cas4 (RecB family)
MDQLRFYKLLYELKYPAQKVQKGLLIFVEEPQTHEFALLEDDKELITGKIVSTFEKVHKLEFDACDMRKQEADGCKFCNYKLLCRVNAV